MYGFLEPHSITFTLTLLRNINILIVQWACMFLLNSALKGFDDSPRSKSKTATRWIVVKLCHLNNASCLQNYILLPCRLICT